MDFLAVRQQYDPYSRYESFDRGLAHYFRGWKDSPYPKDSIDDKSWRCGHEFGRTIHSHTFKK
jgi:hypothetical protein